jgi:hypothetical protein
MARSMVCAAVVLMSLVLAGCNRLSFGDPVESMTLYSLDGIHEVDEWDKKPRGEEKAKGELFHRFPVLGKTEITSASDRSAILAAVKKGIAKNNGRPNKCFWPRHGLTLVQNGRHIEFVICFECLQLDEYTDGQRVRKLTADAASGLMNEHLEKAHVPLAK